VLVITSLIGAGGVTLLVSAWLQPAPSLRRTLDHLRRGRAFGETTDARAIHPTGWLESAGRSAVVRLAEVVGGRPALVPSEAQLRLLGRSIEQHVTYLAAAAVGGALAPSIVVAMLRWAGVVGLGWYAPVAAALAGLVLGPLVLHTASIERAGAIRTDLRYQVSAYLDVVTMLLAGNTGYEGALEQAARAGDGRLFAELRRRMRESSARGASLTEALHRTGAELGLEELEQIAATAALSAAEGAPVARTLAAKCATLRGALATEQETEARLRTSRLTTPIVGMALIFMSLVIYPALSFS
jgi:Flp pilus assembly protein TadB